MLDAIAPLTYFGCMSQPLLEPDGIVPPLTLGWRLRMALGIALMSIEDMADELGVSRSTVGRWLNDGGHPTRGYLRLWALRTGVDFTWLTTGLPRRDSNSEPAVIVQDAPPSVGGDVAQEFRSWVPLRKFESADLAIAQ